MTISKDLFLAILSMDAYNRGYGSGINFGANSDAVGIPIGNATIYDTRGDAPAQSAGFYGIAYNTSAVSGFSPGKKTIAYRGTDQLFPGLVIGGDIWNAYGIGAGSPAGNQAQLAIQFYQAVAGAGADQSARGCASWPILLDVSKCQANPSTADRNVMNRFHVRWTISDACSSQPTGNKV